jgi:hypothetical protein
MEKNEDLNLGGKNAIIPNPEETLSNVIKMTKRQFEIQEFKKNNPNKYVVDDMYDTGGGFMREIPSALSTVDHEKKHKIDTAFQINVYDYGNSMIEILSQRQKIAGRLLQRDVDETEYNQLEILFEYYNAKIKLILGL